MSGAGYGHNGGRQQRKRPRDFDEDQYRRPRTVDTLEKMKRDLINLTDPGSIDALEDVRFVARRLAADFEIFENQGTLLNILRDSILQFSIKTTQYAAMVALASSQNHDFGEQVITMICDCFGQAFLHREWRDAKLLLRFMATLNPCLDSKESTVVKLLDDLASLVRDSQQENRTEFADRISYLILMTMPFLSVSTLSRKASISDDLSALLDKLSPYMKQRRSLQETSTKHYINSDMFDEREVLEVLMEQCQQLASAGWKVDFLPNLLDPLAADIKFGTLKAPEIILKHDDSIPEALAPLQYHFELFTNQSVQSVPPMSHLASSVYRDLATDVLDLFVTNRKDAARFLIDFESYLPSGLFVLRGTPLDKIIPGGASWKAEDIVVESAFAQLFTLPVPSHKYVYYHSVLTELCKLVPQAIAPTFGRAIRLIYSRLTELDAELTYRFWDWFSHHLSNFGFNWKWQEWIPDLSLPSLHPKSVFIRETILKEAELSYNQRIKTTLPSEYLELIPDDAPGPNFAHNMPDSAFQPEVSHLQSFLGEKDDAAQVEPLLQAIRSKAVDSGLDEEHVSITILVQSVLQLGHQSFSHALSTLENNLSLLKGHCNSSASSGQVTVEAVMNFWSGRPFVASALLQKFINYRIINPISVLQHLLTTSDIHILSQSHTWELIKTTIDKVNARVIQVKERLARADQFATSEADSKSIGSEEELRQLRLSWSDVQAEQKDVLTYVVQKFSEKTQDDEAEWAAYWTKGLFREILRRYSRELSVIEGLTAVAPEFQLYLT